MNDTVADLVQRIAKQKIKEGFQFLTYSEIPVPEDVNKNIKKIVALLKATLTEEGPAKYKQLIPIIKVQDIQGIKTDDEIRAESMCYCLIEDEIRSILIQNKINQTNTDSVLFKKFPELKKELDKDGLLKITLFDKILIDAVQYKDHVLYLTTPYRLTRKLLELSEVNKTTKIRLDNSKVVHVSNYLEALAEDFYFGPPFKEEDFTKKLFIKNQTTTLVRNPKTEIERLTLQAFFSRIEKFEVNRSEKEPEVFISAEELPPIEVDDIDLNFIETKLFHSNFDLSKSKVLLEHADFTTLIYEIKTYEDRLQKTIKDKVKAVGHYKHFWIGNITFSEWKELYFQVFSKNELAEEYITGKPWKP